MTEKLEIYKCDVCGNIVQVLCNGVGELVCCGQPMKILPTHLGEKSEEAEKHLPTFETDVNGRFIRVKHHPMTEEHYIQFIEAISETRDTVHIKLLRPKDVAEFDITGFGNNLEALEMCNLHGLWANKSNEQGE